MADLSPAAALEAFQERHELIGPFDGNWPELCLAAVFRRLADHKPRPWSGQGPLCHWHPSQKTRQELRNMAEELEGTNG